MRSSVIARTIVLDRLVKSWRAAHFGAVVIISLRAGNPVRAFTGLCAFV